MSSKYEWHDYVGYLHTHAALCSAVDLGILWHSDHPAIRGRSKYEYLNIKNVNRDDMMAAHRMPPQMIGIIPNNTDGLSYVGKASCVFVRNELPPLQKRQEKLNGWLDEEVSRFGPYTLDYSCK